MTTPATDLAQAARVMREAAVSKAYRTTPVGTMVARYIRWFRNERGATDPSVRDYEAILARMSLALADKELIEVTTDDLREVIDLWADRAARTRAKVTSVFRAFWRWCAEEGHIEVSPAARIRRPHTEQRVARVLPPDARPWLLKAAESSRDRLALFCLLSMGLRRAEVAQIRFRDFDLARQRLYVFGKGKKERLLPLHGPILVELKRALEVDLPHVGRPPQADDYLLYPVDRRADGKTPDGRGIAWSHTGRPKDKPSPQSVHRWWYRHAQAAGLVAPGATSGLNMHRARHTFAMELRRVANLESASHALGHADLSTTLGIYGHFDETDLEKAMNAYGVWLQDTTDRTEN